MPGKYPAQQKRKPAFPIIINAVTASMIAGGIAVWAAFYAAPPEGWNADHSFATSLPWLLELLSVGWGQAVDSQNLLNHFQNPMVGINVFLNNFDRFDLLTPISWRLMAVGSIPVLTALGVGLYTYLGLEKVDGLKHIRGRQLLCGRKATRQAARNQRKPIRTYGRGIKIAPGISISRETETKHFLLVGASGGGKTQTLLYWVEQIIAGEGRMIIHDTKGDITSTLPQDDFILLAPHDSRSWAWDIAKDCKGMAAARELASRLIPLGHDPMWGNGAREILTGIIRVLQVQHGDKWNWGHLRDTAFLSPPKLLELLDEVHPEGAQYIDLDDDGTPGKTSFSFLVTLWSSIGTIVTPLTLAWGNVPEDQKVSLTAWLNDDQTAQRTIVLQRSSEFSDLSEAWIGAAVQLMANYAASASFGDSPTRRLWLFLDEFAQLGKLKGFQQFLEVGRSRGIRCAIGIQDLEQLSELYGQEALKTWLNTIETKIVCRMNAGPSAKFIAEDLIGQREVSWKERTVTKNSGDIIEGRSGTRSVNDQIRTATVPVILPDFLEQQIGPRQIGGETKISALLLSRGDLYQLLWPITHWPNKRPASEPAAWTLG